MVDFIANAGTCTIHGWYREGIYRERFGVFFSMAMLVYQTVVIVE